MEQHSVSSLIHQLFQSSLSWNLHTCSCPGGGQLRPNRSLLHAPCICMPWLALSKLLSLCQLSLALGFQRCQLWPTCLISHGINPVFHYKVSIPDHLLHQTVWFLAIWGSCHKRMSLQKKNWKHPVVGGAESQPLLWKIQHRVCQKGISWPHPFVFLHLQDVEILYEG